MCRTRLLREQWPVFPQAESVKVAVDVGLAAGWFASGGLDGVVGVFPALLALEVYEPAPSGGWLGLERLGDSALAPLLALPLLACLNLFSMPGVPPAALARRSLWRVRLR